MVAWVQKQFFSRRAGSYSNMELCEPVSWLSNWVKTAVTASVEAPGVSKEREPLNGWDGYRCPGVSEKWLLWFSIHD